MNEVINEKVSVITLFDCEKRVVLPKKIRWQGRDYFILKLSYHHKIKQGTITFHIFHVTDGNMDFRLSLNTDNLHWTLEEVCDGTTN